MVGFQGQWSVFWVGGFYFCEDTKSKILTLE